MNAFQKAVLQVPVNSRCIQTGKTADESARKKSYGWSLPVDHLYFGVDSERLGWPSFSELPAQVKGVSFIMGGVKNKPLISSFIASGYAAKVERLSIGTARGNAIDQKNALSALKGVSFPNLRVLELGIWKFFQSSESSHGDLGDVTSILAACPKLEQLGLYGKFVISKPMLFKHLKVLNVEPADSLRGDQSINVASFNSVFGSDFPVLEQLRFVSELDQCMSTWPDRSKGIYRVRADANVYKFPDKFLSKASMPLLKSIFMFGEFEKGEKNRLLNSGIGKRPSVKTNLQGFNEITGFI